MKQKIIMEKYPVYELEIPFNETNFKSVDAIIQHLRSNIEEHPIAIFIAIFDHYAHTTTIESGVVGEGIEDAKNIIFCFGKELKVPEVLAVRPRSIGVAKMQEKFIVTFLEAPNDAINETMEGWAKKLVNML
ncbi:MAG: hypothetical protein JXQ68_04460 [Campylobacterales bacterium]|nr:hypothetical protein [Campylobacterales bacterium]